MPSTGPRRSATERVAQIAEAAQGLAREAGLHAVTLRGVAHEIGVAPALVAHYAPSMDTLVAETFTTIVTVERAEVAELAGRCARPAEAIAAVLSSLLDPSRADVTLIWVQSWALGGRNPALAEQVRDEMDRWRSFLAGLIEEGRRREDFRCEDPEAVAAQVLGMIDGLNAHSLVSWQGEDERMRLLLRSVETMLELRPGSLPAAISY